VSELYKLIIVDDEFFIRKGLESFHWEGLGFQCCGSAANGKNALELINNKKIDVVITDIKMPVMDGLELSRIIHQKDPDCKIVILTGYEDFSYAKTAIGYGVFDYILKPVDLNELSNTFGKLKTSLDNAREKNVLLLSYEKKLKESLPYAVENLFKEILNKELTDLDEIEEKMDLLEINFKKPYFMCADYKVNCSEKVLPSSRDRIDIVDVKNRLEGFFSSKEINYILMTDIDSVGAIINFDSDAASYYQYIEYLLLQSIAELKKLLKNCTHYSLHISAGDVYRNILALPYSLKQVDLLKEKCFFEMSECIYFAWKENLVLADSVPEYPYDIENKLTNAILEGNKQAGMQYLDEFFTVFLKNRLRVRPDYLKTVASQLLNILDRRFNKNNMSLGDLIGEYAPFTKLIDAQRSFADLKSCLQDIVNKVTDYINSINSSVKTSAHTAVKKAVAYIHEHYNTKITLNQVAEYVYLNASYLSIQFKKETGKNFIEYVKEYRMEKAKELLKKTDLKIYNICEMVGYEKQQYCSDSFKAYTGMTPLEYRQRTLA